MSIINNWRSLALISTLLVLALGCLIGQASARPASGGEGGGLGGLPDLAQLLPLQGESGGEGGAGGGSN